MRCGRFTKVTPIRRRSATSIGTASSIATRIGAGPCHRRGAEGSRRDDRRASADHPIAGVSRRAKDFTYPAALADALLHPQDRAYTVPELYAWLGRCGLSFGRWVEQAPYLPQCGAIAGLPHAAHLVSLTSLEQHAVVELLRGTMTQHNFIAHRNDRGGASQPITFGDDAWLSWVPLRLPWTLCIRDRVPRGIAAVLINRAHTYADFALPIDEAQERIFTAIDGTRSCAEIPTWHRIS